LSVLHFLLVYDLRRRELRSAREFRSADEAARAYGEAEREYISDENVEIVLVGADSLGTIRQTHGHYFNDGQPKVLLPELSAR
jgi:hypothetical protein